MCNKLFVVLLCEYGGRSCQNDYTLSMLAARISPGHIGRRACECRPIIELNELPGCQARQGGLQELRVRQRLGARLACPLGLPQHGLQRRNCSFPHPCTLCIQRQLHRSTAAPSALCRSSPGSGAEHHASHAVSRRLSVRSASTAPVAHGGSARGVHGRNPVIYRGGEMLTLRCSKVQAGLYFSSACSISCSSTGDSAGCPASLSRWLASCRCPQPIATCKHQHCLLHEKATGLHHQHTVLLVCAHAWRLRMVLCCERPWAPLHCRSSVAGHTGCIFSNSSTASTPPGVRGCLPAPWP